MGKIDVLCYCNTDPNGLEYASFQRKTLDAFASGKNTIRYKVFSSYQAYNMNLSPDGYTCIGACQKWHPQPSMEHGIALTYGVKVLDAEYCIVIDADVAITYDKWDQIVVEKLTDFDFWGWEPPHGYNRGAYDFPVVFFCAFRKDVLNKSILDFRPKLEESLTPCRDQKVAKKKIDTVHEANAYNLPIGSTLKCDTGYMLPKIAHDAGLSHSTIPYVRQDYLDSLLPYKDESQKQLCLGAKGGRFVHRSHMSEWHYAGKVFGTHKQACRSHPISDGIGAAWKWRVQNYCRNTWGKEIV